MSLVMNHRDHRKIVVVDGSVAYTGGINLADEYINAEERFGYWKDAALRTEGAKVSDINMCRLINPVLGAVLSWIMLPGEYPHVSTVAGMAIIVGSLVIYFKGEILVERWRRRRL